jgi:hypothetical protein
MTRAFVLLPAVLLVAFAVRARSLTPWRHSCPIPTTPAR